MDARWESFAEDSDRYNLQYRTAGDGKVRNSKYPATSHDEAMARDEEALQRDTKGIFRFNSGLEKKTVLDYNPYTIRTDKIKKRTGSGDILCLVASLAHTLSILTAKVAP